MGNMDALDCIAMRISVRKYDKKIMSQEEMKAILKAGMEAPSASNRRPYEFIVNAENDFWKDFVLEKPTCEIMRQASLTIVIVGDSNKNPTPEFLYEDCSATAENMLLAAQALGYGSLWAGVRSESDFAKKLIAYFALPSGDLPIAVLMFGQPSEKKAQVDRYDEKKIHFGKF
jgi:nitroreductase